MKVAERAFAFLMAYSRAGGSWTPKHHLFCHLVNDIMQHGNPRYSGSHKAASLTLHDDDDDSVAAVAPVVLVSAVAGSNDAGTGTTGATQCEEDVLMSVLLGGASGGSRGREPPG